MAMTITDECIDCAACVDVCPTGSLKEKSTQWGGKPEGSTTTTCGLCSAGCTLTMEYRWDAVMNVRPDPAGPTRVGDRPLVATGLQFRQLQPRGVEVGLEERPVEIDWRAAGRLRGKLQEDAAAVEPRAVAGLPTEPLVGPKVSKWGGRPLVGPRVSRGGETCGRRFGGVGRPSPSAGGTFRAGVALEPSRHPGLY